VLHSSLLYHTWQRAPFQCGTPTRFTNNTQHFDSVPLAIFLASHSYYYRLFYTQHHWQMMPTLRPRLGWTHEATNIVIPTHKYLQLQHLQLLSNNATTGVYSVEGVFSFHP